MDWVHPLNDTSNGKKIVITAVHSKDSDSRIEVQSVELVIGNQDDMLEDCECVVLTKKEWVEIRRKVNQIFK